VNRLERNDIQMNIISNPSDTTEPYYFSNKEGSIEGATHHISSILKTFEPMDVLNGETRIYDSSGLEMILVVDDQSVIEKNEYPKGYDGIHCEMVDSNKEHVLQKIASIGQVEFID
jgi:hypothetical protein